MNKRKYLRFFLMNQDPGDGGGGAPAAAPAPAAAATDTGGATAAAPAAAPAQTDNSPTSWLQSLPDAEAKAYAESKGWKDPADAVKAIREMETKYAVPQSPDAYQFPVPEGQDGALAKQAAAWFHEAGVPVDAAQAVVKKWNEMATAAETHRQQQIQQELSALKSEWGTQYDANLELGRRVMRTFGVSPEVIDKVSGQMGDAATLRLFQQIGKGLSEGTLNPGSGGGGNTAPVDPDAARAARMFPSMQPKS
jgi:hypothetical protein